MPFAAIGGFLPARIVDLSFRIGSTKGAIAAGKPVTTTTYSSGSLLINCAASGGTAAPFPRRLRISALRTGKALRKESVSAIEASEGLAPSPPPPPEPRRPLPPPPPPLSTSDGAGPSARWPPRPRAAAGIVIVMSLAHGELVITFLTSSSVHCMYSFEVQKSSASAALATRSPTRHKKSNRCIIYPYGVIATKTHKIHKIFRDSRSLLWL